MAFSLHSTFLKSQIPIPIPISATATVVVSLPVRCGPRDNRGPLVKGRTLSTEAIQAIQSLKRAEKSDPTKLEQVLSTTLSRLLKADLVATLKELLRQDRCALALEVFAVVRSEYGADLGMYAEVAAALSRNGAAEEIDRLVCDLEDEDRAIQCDDKGLIKLIKAVIGGDRRESTVRIYRMMKRSGWGSTIKADDYTVRVLSKGLRRLGEMEMADEVNMQFQDLVGSF
ncbi:protein THYLAKOID ASSEMBLY 8, chloroplastic-like [Cucurbita pepo subsp. pepo]|uniref:protein THYLAKOID ASSEMBLY 8, chloroplastic-like n=1 Tax=Cucurbita pepo subsp. pepo TaxID=3664 RepID=UPI000C9D945D|nr:protein THYLAKOID ASSEMBLY 8, chloroplastic-like [Cucurbita pepo subsp. pepo]XP_023548438.1 protein THYLAKOID ASSEMBLY 8, chloroplastic-like [Cucurbita pepo subsp. pepo]XP_023548440.1 protein THYLAKOID ASSEMBLY 8, chloroplastic-like [Cucurbita pepo subsp. pepo]